jgi:hypothetical protein
MAVALVLVIGLAAAGLAFAIVREFRALRREATLQAILRTFGDALGAVHQDPRLLLAWHPTAESARKLFPDAFASLDAARGERFPFSRDLVERAHARWSTEWLAWERSHDEEYRIKGASVEQEIGATSGEAAKLAKARLDRVQHEKIERYQQRYEEYIRTAQALQALLG